MDTFLHKWKRNYFGVQSSKEIKIIVHLIHLEDLFNYPRPRLLQKPYLIRMNNWFYVKQIFRISTKVQNSSEDIFIFIFTYIGSVTQNGFRQRLFYLLQNEIVI